MTKFVLAVCLLFSVVGMTGCDDGYAKQNQQISKDLFHNQLPDYTFLQTAGGTNAVGTMRSKACQRPFQECWILADPGTWFASSVSAQDRQGWMARIVKQGDFGSIKLTRAIKTSIDVKTELPNISNVLSAEANLDLSKANNVSLEATNVTQMELNAIEIKNAASANVFQPAVLDILKSGNYKIVQADIRYSGYKLVVDSSNNVGLTTTLKALETAAKVIGKDAGLNLTVQHTSDTQFAIVDSDPVVIAYLVSDAVPSPDLSLTLTGGVRIGALRHAKIGHKDKDALDTLFHPKK